MIREYFGTQTACKIATLLIENSMPFDITPMPYDVFEFKVKDERANLLPPENVRRDALTESEGADAPVLKCKYCGREYECDDGLGEGDPCPSDDCPSHEYEVDCGSSSNSQPQS